jgi:hypothetical protein
MLRVKDVLKYDQKNKAGIWGGMRKEIIQDVNEIIKTVHCCDDFLVNLLFEV